MPGQRKMATAVTDRVKSPIDDARSALPSPPLILFTNLRGMAEQVNPSTPTLRADELNPSDPHHHCSKFSAPAADCCGFNFNRPISSSNTNGWDTDQS